MATSINTVTIMGFVGRDPEIRVFQNGTKKCVFSVATTESWTDANGDLKEKTEWHRIATVGRLAEIAQQYVSKGSRVLIEGSLQTFSYQDPNNITRVITEILAKNVHLLDSKKQDKQQDYHPMYAEV